MPTAMQDILADEPSVHTLPEGPGDPPSPAPELPDEEPSGEKPAAEPPASAAPPETGDDEDEPGGEVDPADLKAPGLQKALKAERKLRKDEVKKRRELEQRLAHLDGQVTALRQPPQIQKDPDPEEIATDFYGNPVAHLDKRERVLFDKIQNQILTERANTSEAMLRLQHEDYDEVKAAFVAAAEKSPDLWGGVWNHPVPAAVVYEQGRRLMLDSDPEAKMRKLEAELARLKGTIAPETTTVEAAKPKQGTVTHIKPSIARARGSGASTTSSWDGPTSLRDIIGPKTARR